MDNTVERLVDSEAIAKFMDCEVDHVRKMARQGLIPGRLISSGKRQFWRFKLSEVDSALAKGDKA